MRLPWHRAHLLTIGAALLLHLVFDHYHALGRQINHLAALHLLTLNFAQVSLTVLAELHRVDNHLIGRGREHQGVPWMTGLPAGLLATWLAQTLGLPMKAVRGWRQMAVVAIFLQALLQGLHLPRQQLSLLLQSLNQALLLVDHRLLHVNCLLLQTGSFPQRLILFSQGDQFFFWCHGSTVLGSGLQGKSCSTPEWLQFEKEVYKTVGIFEFEQVFCT